MNFSEEHRDYLKHKHQGGINQSKGRDYEDNFATKEIIRLFAYRNNFLSDDTLKKILICNQVSNNFVDDMQIIYPSGSIMYHQCKNCKSLNWGKEKKGDLLYDFKWQKHYSEANGEDFIMKIVYSSPECSLHKESIPEQIEKVTDKEFFPSYDNLSLYVVKSDNFRKNITRILFVFDEKDNLERWCAFAEIVKSQVAELCKPDKKVSLAEIKRECVRKYPYEANFKNLPNVKIPKDLINKFSEFPDLEYAVNGKIVYWKYGRIDGEFEYSDKLSQMIIDSDPVTIYDLIILLNEEL